MSSPKTLPLQLAGEHCQAICEEVGEQLRILLDRESGELPPRLRSLLDRLAELDHAPSIVPALDDMTVRSVAASDRRRPASTPPSFHRIGVVAFHHRE
jgi:hypothetical protein